MLSAGFTFAGRVVRRAENASSAPESRLPREAVERLDAQLAELARGSGRARLGIGELLEALAKHGGHHDLGFSSLGAYARERCGQSGRWAVESRTVARRLAELSVLRRALASGALGWCMAELVARHVTPESEAKLVAQALRSTVREMRARFDDDGQTSALEPEEAEEKVTLTLTLSQADAWLFEWTRRLVEHTGGQLDTDETVNALLAEASSSLVWEVPACDLERCLETGSDAEAAREQAWRAQLAEWRVESERRCEANFRERGPGGADSGAEVIPLFEPERCGARALDARIVESCAEYSAAQVEFARAAVAFHEAGGALRLGYSSDLQYCRERLGMSHASFKASVALARRWPERVRLALEQREIGYEAALLISRVATADTAKAWVARARERTVKHLGEEVRAAELVRAAGGSTEPPAEQTVNELHELEARLLAGDREAVLAGRSQLSALLAQGASQANVQVRLRVTRDTARFFRGLEGAVRRHLPPKMSFVALLCEYFWDAWKHPAERREAWANIYARDRYTCSNPVCPCRDVTPHHIEPKSMGGGDEHDNVSSLCFFCHLRGVHENRIKVTGKVGALVFPRKRSYRGASGQARGIRTVKIRTLVEVRGIARCGCSSCARSRDSSS